MIARRTPTVPWARVALVLNALLWMLHSSARVEASTTSVAIAAPTSPTRIDITGQTFFVAGAANFNLQLRVVGDQVDRLLDGSNRSDAAATPRRNPAENSLGPQLMVTSYPAVSKPTEVLSPPAALSLGEVSIALAGIANRTDAGLDINVALTPDQLMTLNIVRPGVYPLDLSIVDNGQTIDTKTTFVQRTASQVRSNDQLHVGILARVDDVGPMPTTADIERAREQLGELLSVAEATSLPLSVVLPPNVLNEVVRDDSTLQQSLQRALAGDTLLSTPGYELHPDAARRAGVEDDFAQTWQYGKTRLRSYFPNSTVDDATVIVDAPLSRRGVDIWRNVGVRFALLPYSTYLSADGQIGALTDPGLLIRLRAAETDSLSAMTSDAALTLLSTAQQPDSTANLTPTHRAALVLAVINARQASPDTERRSAILTTPEMGVPDAEVIAALDAIANVGAEAEAGTPIVWSPVPKLNTLTDSLIVDRRPLGVSWANAAPSVIDDRVQHVEKATTIIQDAVSMLPAEDPRRESWVRRVRSAESTALTDQQASELISGSVAQAEQLRTAVPAPEPFDFTLTGANSTLRFQLSNTTETPLNVVFVAKSTRLITPERTSVVLAPSAVTNVPLEVSARSNGTASVFVHVETPSGRVLFPPVEITGRSATFGGLGKVATVGALLVLMSWWFAHLRVRRSRIRDSAAS